MCHVATCTVGVTGQSAVEGLVASGALGSNAPLAWAALSRNTSGPAAQALASRGIALVQVRVCAGLACGMLSHLQTHSLC